MDNDGPGRWQYSTCPALRTPPYPAHHRQALSKLSSAKVFQTIWLGGHLTSPHLRVQEAGNAQLSLSEAEGEAVVGEDVGRVETFIVQEVRSKVMDDRAECEAVPEGS